MSNSYDFKGQASALMKRIWKSQGTSVNPDLARAAVEVALREAYAQGLKDARGGAGQTSPSANPNRPTAPTAASSTCAHAWEETFLDGRAVGGQCIHCGILQRDVKEECKHYFVAMGSGEVCVACRRTRKAK